eukprot:Tbor_TRINITY_DN5826_c3_g2::TRINITY_DN5826_c3_g2_i1::g.6092::m.6092
MNGHSEPAWTPVKIMVSGKVFQTTFETLQQFGKGIELTSLFSEPFPLYDSYNKCHVIPPSICPDPDIFEYIMQFLRTEVWTLPPELDIYNAVCNCCTALGLPSRPMSLVLLSENTPVYHHEVIRLPVPCKGLYVIDPNSDDEGEPIGNSEGVVVSNGQYTEDMNTTMMLQQLGYKGYKVVSECRALGTSTETEVILRRKVPQLKGLEELARHSQMFQRLQECA